jgi:hypothetical protein
MALWIPLFWAGVLTILCLLVHGLGIVAIARLLKLEEQRLRNAEVGVSAFVLLTGLGICVFLLHMVEIGIFAGFFVGAGIVPRLEEALYISAASYSTLGTSATALPADWALVGAIEGVAGFLLLGWSAAFFVTDMNLLLRQK